jgi:hypothetical protein
VSALARVQSWLMLQRMLWASTLGTCLLMQCPPASADSASAEALFREGRALLERGQIDAACEKLEASNALEASAGTLLNLATCREKQGKTATAWAIFVSAEHLAQNQNRPEQAAEATRRASELEARLATLTLVVREPVPGLVVRRAGRVVPAASFGTPLPVDLGAVVIDASASGYEPTRIEVTFGTPAEQRTLEIPKLRKVATPDATSRSGSNAGSASEVGTQLHTDTNTTLPWTIGIVGGATLVAGGVLGALALSSNGKAVSACDKENNAAECTETQNRRDNQALASTVCVGLGVIGLGVATIWLLTGHSGRQTSSWSYQGEVTRDSALLRMRVGF